jgi:hypothetical protein
VNVSTKKVAVSDCLAEEILEVLPANLVRQL